MWIILKPKPAMWRVVSLSAHFVSLKTLLHQPKCETKINSSLFWYKSHKLTNSLKQRKKIIIKKYICVNTVEIKRFLQLTKYKVIYSNWKIHKLQITKFLIQRSKLTIYKETNHRSIAYFVLICFFLFSCIYLYIYIYLGKQQLIGIYLAI